MIINGTLLSDILDAKMPMPGESALCLFEKLMGTTSMNTGVGIGMRGIFTPVVI